MNRLKQLWSWIQNFFIKKDIKVLEKKLEKSLINQIKQRTELKSEIDAYVRKKLNLNARSQFIKPKLKNRVEIINMVYKVFGDRMKETGLVLKLNLEYNR